MATVVPSMYKTMSWSERRRVRIPDERKQEQKLPDYGPGNFKWHELWDSMNDRASWLATKVNGHIYRVQMSSYIGAHTASRDNDRLDKRAGDKASMLAIAEARIAQEPTRHAKARRAKRAVRKSGTSVLKAALRRDRK